MKTFFDFCSVTFEPLTEGYMFADDKNPKYFKNETDAVEFAKSLAESQKSKIVWMEWCEQDHKFSIDEFGNIDSIEY